MIFTVANVALSIGLGTLIAFLLVRVSTWVRVLLTAGARVGLVDARRRCRPDLDLDDQLPERDPELRPDRARLGDYDGHDWYGSSFSQLSMVTLFIVWGAIPFVAVTVYAGLAQVPRELVEAAEIDGAGPLRVFRDVTFPILKPIFLILTSLSIIWDFGVFTQPYLLIGPSEIDTRTTSWASTSSSRATRTPTWDGARRSPS